MGYDTGKYGNLMASVHSIIGRLEKRGEIRSSGTIGGKPAHAWVPKTLIEQFGQGVAEGMAGAAGESPYGALAGIAEQMSDINKESASLAIAAEERKKAKKP
jgi:hypothetical protein